MDPSSATSLPTQARATPRTPASSLAAACRGDLAAAGALLDCLLAVEGARTLENTLVAFNRLSLHVSNARLRAALHANVHPDRDVRAAAEACQREAVAFANDLALDRRLFDALGAIDLSGLPADARRLLEHTLRDFRRAGAELDPAARERLRALKRREVELGQRFDRNVREDVRRIEVEPVRLAGLPEDYVRAHPPGPGGKVTITTDYPDFLPFRAYGRDAAARRALFGQFANRGHPANDELLRELLEVRREQARLLGYASWADYVTEDKMVGSAREAGAFIEEVSRAARGRAARDYALLLARKRRDDPGADVVDLSENRYYEELVQRETFGFDSQEIRPYFEFARVLQGVLETTSRLFGVAYEPAANVETWHPDVRVYDVTAAGRVLGRIYLDLHPREGKFKHAAHFALAKGVAGEQSPAGVLVMNLPDPRFSAGPALLQHEEVVTLFHEFGHLLHHLLAGSQRWVAFSGLATEWDFIEVPSQLLEEWAWDPATLRTFARHHASGEPLPLDLVQRMRAADEFGKGTWLRHNMFYSALSLLTHTAPDPGGLDLLSLTRELLESYSPYAYVPGTHPYASFGHLTGYSAMYYTYAWSLVIAKDLFSAFERAGLYDRATARAYRERVLAPGGSLDAAELVEAFLGRPHGFAAFRAWLERGEPASDRSGPAAEAADTARRAP